MNRRFLVLVAVALAAGCQATRAWQARKLPTHDRQRAFEAARDVIGRHFEIAEANWIRGVIRTEPQISSEGPATTMADVRRDVRYRRTVTFELGREGLEMTGRAAVLLEREGTAEAVAMAAHGPQAIDEEVPRAMPTRASARAREAETVWTGIGWDESLARELLAEIARTVEAAEGGEVVPDTGDVRRLMEDSKAYGEE